MEFEPMLKFNYNFKPNPREKLLETRIENLQERIRELERRSSLLYSSQTYEKNNVETNNSSFLVLPVTYTPAQEPSPKLEIVPYSSEDQSKISILLVKQSKSRIYESVV